MPSYMIHLLAARLADDTRGPLYYVGSLAPDACRSSWREKDHAHLRDHPDRAQALAAIARRVDPGDDFAEGALLHLYVDWKWDTKHLRRWLDVNDAGDYQWVEGYKNEISLASAWLYWSHDWAPGLWESMLATKPGDYGELEGIAPEDIYSLMSRGHRWLREHKGPPSAFYPPDVAERFARETAKGYRAWRRENSNFK